MCGICGVRRFGPEPIDPNVFTVMLLDNEHRGNMATGIATQQLDGSVQVLKEDSPAWTFVKRPQYKAFLEANFREDTVAVLGHTRLSTKGSATFNKNNHPIFDDETAVIHNGVLNNDDFLFKDMKLERVAETDTDIIRAIVTEHGVTPRAITELNRISGSAAIAVVSTRYPGKLLLARSGSPLELATTNDHLVWSSERNSIHKALRPYYQRFGFYMRRARVDAGFMPMSNNEAYIIGDRPKVQAGDLRDADWIEFNAKFNTAGHYTPPKYNVNSESYFRNRMVIYGEERVTVIVCKECKALMAITPEQAKRIKRLRCERCKTMVK